MLLKSRLNKRNLRPSGKEGVEVTIIEEWGKITVEEIQRVVDKCWSAYKLLLIQTEGTHGGN